MTTSTNPSALLPFAPDAMTPAQQAAVSFLARYAGHTHELVRTNRLDPLVGIHRAHVELFIRHLGERGLMASSINTSMHAVRGYFRFAHIDGLIPTWMPHGRRRRQNEPGRKRRTGWPPRTRLVHSDRCSSG